MKAKRLWVAGLLISCAIAATAETERAYRLGPNDYVLVRAVDIEEFPQEPIRIEESGEINLPLVGRIEAGGMTLKQLQGEVVLRLQKYLHDPQVTVAITEFRSQPVSIFGAVARPGVLQVRGPRTLWEVISDVGGLQNDAGDRIKIVRPIEQGAIPLPGAHVDPTGKYSVAEIDARSIRTMENPGENITVMPNDVISVSQADVIYVMGDVHRAGGFVTNGSISVLEALSLAGGYQPRAAPSKAVILRTQLETDERLQIPIDLKRLIEGKAEDLRLKPSDILFVPHSTMKDITLGALQAVTSIATSVVIWRAGTGR
jgi:polysaccharide export outer membrane protein